MMFYNYFLITFKWRKEMSKEKEMVQADNRNKDSNFKTI